MGFDVLDAQVGFHGHKLYARFGCGKVAFCIGIKIDAERGTGCACIQTECGNPVFRQHGDFAAGIIDRALAGEHGLLYVAAGFYGKRRGGDVDADAFFAAAQILHRQCVVYFGGGIVVYGKGAYVCLRQVFRLPGRGDVGETRAVGKIFVFKLLHQIIGQPADGADVFCQFVKR